MDRLGKRTNETSILPAMSFALLRTSLYVIHPPKTIQPFPSLEEPTRKTAEKGSHLFPFPSAGIIQIRL
jgi:hypothetical protein